MWYVPTLAFLWYLVLLTPHKAVSRKGGHGIHRNSRLEKTDRDSQEPPNKVTWEKQHTDQNLEKPSGHFTEQPILKQIL